MVKYWPALNMVVAGLLLIAGIMWVNDIDNQSVAPQCFSKEDCFVAQAQCGTTYDCIAGACYHFDNLCPEDCSSGIDEDKDGLTDCHDEDCWNNPSCSCTMMSYNMCKANQCYCPEGQKAKWHVNSEGNYCGCTL